jgi:hypothetical protein
MQPLRLFKYLPPERVDILEQQRITFTPPERFNDAFDTKPKVIPIANQAFIKSRTNPYTNEALAELPSDYQNLPRRKRREIARELHKGFLKHMKENAQEFAEKLEASIPVGINKIFGLLCLSTESNNELMWAHYAKGNEGFVIEFKVDHQAFQQLGTPHEIIHSDSIPTYDPTIGSQEWWKMKKKIWEYEHEYRIITILSLCQVEEKSGQKLFFRNLPANGIKAVYIGLKTPNEIKTRIQNVCTSSGIEIFEAKYARDGRKIEYHKK